MTENKKFVCPWGSTLFPFYGSLEKIKKIDGCPTIFYDSNSKKRKFCSRSCSMKHREYLKRKKKLQKK